MSEAETAASDASSEPDDDGWFSGDGPLPCEGCGNDLRDDGTKNVTLPCEVCQEYRCAACGVEWASDGPVTCPQHGGAPEHGPSLREWWFGGDLHFREHPLRWLVWLLDEGLDRLPLVTWYDRRPRWYWKGGWGCRLRLHRFWLPPEPEQRGDQK